MILTPWDLGVDIKEIFLLLQEPLGATGLLFSMCLEDKATDAHITREMAPTMEIGIGVILPFLGQRWTHTVNKS